jgi:hypothetical protein
LATVEMPLLLALPFPYLIRRIYEKEIRFWDFMSL